jgi:hypothetical protein
MVLKFTLSMDKLTIKTPNPICGLYWCLIEFLEIQRVMLVISTGFVNHCSSNLFSG